MVVEFRDRVLELTTTSGAGDYYFGGAALGYQSALLAGCTVGQLYGYFVESIDADGQLEGAFEVGEGVYNTGVLTSVAVFSSSNNNLPVAWSSGLKRIGLALTAYHLTNLNTGVSVINAATRLIQTQRILANFVGRGQI